MQTGADEPGPAAPYALTELGRALLIAIARSRGPMYRKAASGRVERFLERRSLFIVYDSLAPGPTSRGVVPNVIQTLREQPVRGALGPRHRLSSSLSLSLSRRGARPLSSRYALRCRPYLLAPARHLI